MDKRSTNRRKQRREKNQRRGPSTRHGKAVDVKSINGFGYTSGRYLTVTGERLGNTDAVAEIDAAQVNRLHELAIGNKRKPESVATKSDDHIVKALKARGLYQRAAENGRHLITCPWSEEHSGGDLTGTVYMEANYRFPHAEFTCQHTSCKDKRRLPELLAYLGVGEARATTGPEDWPEPEPLPTRGDIGVAPPFPTAELPTAIQQAARESARFNKVPPASPALVGLSALATCIGKRAVIEERQGLTHYPALFMAGIAASGERKSPAFRSMSYPLEEWAEERFEAWEDARRKAKARNTVVDHAISKARTKAKASADLDSATQEVAALEKEKLPIPAHPRLFTTDTTEQRVFQLMHERGGAFAVMSGEGRPVLDAIMGKYSGDNRTGDAIYLAGISGDTITRDRVGGSDNGPEERSIRNPCLNVCILVQPDKYLEAAAHPSLRASGALARIWPVWLESMVGTRMEERDEPGLNAKAMHPYNDLARRLLRSSSAFDPSAETPHKAILSTEAKELRRLFHNQVELLEATGGALADCRDIASKAVSQTCKLALILHLAGNPELLSDQTSTVTVETWRAAQVIGAWFLAEAVRVQRTADEDPLLENARRVLDWLARDKIKTVTSRAVQQSYPRPRPKTAADAEKVLDLLEDHGYLRAIQGQGKRKPAYTVHQSVATVASSRGEK